MGSTPPLYGVSLPLCHGTWLTLLEWSERWGTSPLRVLRWIEWEWLEPKKAHRDEKVRIEFSIPSHVKLLGTIPRGHRKEVLDALALGQWGLTHRHRKNE